MIYSRYVAFYGVSGLIYSFLHSLPMHRWRFCHRYHHVSPQSSRPIIFTPIKFIVTTINDEMFKEHGLYYPMRFVLWLLSLIHAGSNPKRIVADWCASDDEYTGTLDALSSIHPIDCPPPRCV